MAAPVKHRAKKTKKNRKHGRNATACARYAASHRREHNKLRRLKKHLVKFPNDACARAAERAAQIIIRGFA